MSQKIQYTLADETVKIIEERAVSERKRGEFVDRAVAYYDKFLCGQECEDEHAGLLERIAARLGRLEQKFDRLITILDSEQTA